MKPFSKAVFVVVLCWMAIVFSYASTAQEPALPEGVVSDSLKVRQLSSAMERQYSGGQVSADSIAAFYSELAGQYMRQHNFQEAREMVHKSFSKLSDSSNQKLVAANHLLLADMAMEEDDRARAVELLSGALDIYKSVGDSISYLLTLRKVGINYDYVEDHETALEYYEDCIELAQKLGRKDVVGACYNTIAAMHSSDGRHQEAIGIFEKGIEIAEEVGDPELLHRLYHNTSLAYQRLELFGESELFLQKSMKIARELGDLKILGFAHQGFGFHYLRSGRLDSAEHYMNKTLEIALQINNAQLRSNAREALEEVYLKTGRFEQAYNSLKATTAENDSLYNLENTQLIESIKAKYQAEKRDRELAEKNLQLQEAGYNLDKQQNMQTALVVVVVLLLVIIFLIYRGYMLRQRANDLLSVKNSEIESHMAQVQRLTETKSRWFINVAHELRTPLTLIKGPVSRVISQDNLPEEIRADLTLVDRNATNLANLVNEILNLSRLQEGEVSLDESVFSLCETISQVVATFQSRASHLGLELDQQCPVDVFIKADREKLSKVLVNLISNSLKFTDKGGRIDVLVQFREHLEISVKDTGRGISPKDLQYVFDRFYQSSEHGNDLQGGTGIGLSLSKEIAQMHGGELKVSSVLGAGSTFTLVLPSELIVEGPEGKVDEVAVGEVREWELSGGLLALDKKPQLLLVEDNLDMREYVASLLDLYFEVIEAKDGEEALAVLSQKDIKFIISDVMMSGMDGFSLLKKVKADPRWHHLPFIHLSALTDDKLRKEALRIGIDDFLVKPFDPEELIIRVQNLYGNFLNRISAEKETKEDSYDERMMRRLREEVLANIEDSNFNVLRLADGAAMSERQLYRYLKSTTGLTPLQFIQEIKLTRAVEMARKKVYGSTSELASAVGFRQPSYFSTLFERRYGKKPGAFLKA